MADDVFNIAKGKVNEYHDRIVNNDPANSALIVVLLKTAEADATLIDYDTLDAILLAAGNVEADFTNYARKTLTDADLSASTVDDVNDRRESDAPDQEYLSAGGTLDNTLAKVLVCYDPDTTTGDDTNIIPLCFYDFTPTTNGSDLLVKFNSSGYFRAGV